MGGGTSNIFGPKVLASEKRLLYRGILKFAIWRIFFDLILPLLLLPQLLTGFLTNLMAGSDQNRGQAPMPLGYANESYC